MDTKHRKVLINAIMAHLRYRSHMEKKKFDAGDTLLALAFKSDKDLEKIAKLCGV